MSDEKPESAQVPPLPPPLSKGSLNADPNPFDQLLDRLEKQQEHILQLTEHVINLQKQVHELLHASTTHTTALATHEAVLAQRYPIDLQHARAGRTGAMRTNCPNCHAKLTGVDRSKCMTCGTRF